jgi:hypothetical protein
MSNTPQEFYYNISKTQLIVMVIIASALPFLLASIATDNQKGLRLFRIVTLSPNDATLFYWGMAILCAFAALATIFMVFTSLRHPKKVELYATHANLPKASMFGGQLSIPYDLITNISQKRLSATQEMVVIKSALGESRLLASHFKGVLGYEDFLSALSAKTSLTHPSSGTR